VNVWPYRVALLWLAALSAAVALTVCSHFGSSLVDSPLAVATALAAVLATAVGLAAAFLPGARLQRVVAGLCSRWQEVAETPLPNQVRGSVWLFAAAAVTFVLVTARYDQLNTTPARDDQAAFLRLAEQTARAGGPLALPGQLWRGEFVEANRHPLYVALLSLAPTFEAGKRLSLLVGAAGAVLLTWLVDRQFGRPAAAVFAVLLATNAAFCRLTTRVVCDGLLLVLAGLAWWAAERCGGPNSDAASSGVEPPADRNGRRRREASTKWLRASSARSARLRWPWLVLGAALGLCYLTKGTGLLLLLGTLLWGLGELLVRPRQLLQVARGRRRSEGPEVGTAGAGDEAGGAGRDVRAGAAAGASRGSLALGLGLLLAAWLVVACPLLVRNVRVYGSPFYNVNAQLLFEDRFRSPARLAARRSLQQAARQYFQRHSVGEVVWREVSGLAWEAFIVLRSLGPAPWDDARVLPGLLLFVLACVGLFSSARPGRRLVLLWLTLVWLVFAWYVPIAAGDRFVLPLVPALTAYAAVGLLRTTRWWAERPWNGRESDKAGTEGWKRRLSRAVLGVGLAWCAVAAVGTWLVG